MHTQRLFFHPKFCYENDSKPFIAILNENFYKIMERLLVSDFSFLGEIFFLPNWFSQTLSVKNQKLCPKNLLKLKTNTSETWDGNIHKLNELEEKFCFRISWVDKSSSLVRSVQLNFKLLQAFSGHRYNCMDPFMDSYPFKALFYDKMASLFHVSYAGDLQVFSKDIIIDENDLTKATASK